MTWGLECAPAARRIKAAIKEDIPTISFSVLITSLVGLFLLVAVVRLFRKPLKLALRVVLNSALGLGVLWLLNSTAPVTGLTLGVNWFNALTVGVLGLPGLGLLLLVKWVLV